MPKKFGTAREFILDLLTKHPDYEMQIDDLYEEAERKWTKANLANTVARLHAKGLLSKVSEQDRSVWWSIRG